jgi:hypothetical protein
MVEAPDFQFTLSREGSGEWHLQVLRDTASPSPGFSHGGRSP